MRRQALGRGITPGLLLLGLALLGVGLGYVTDGPGLRTLPTTSRAPSDERQAGTIQSIEGDRLTLTTNSGVMTFRLTSDTRFEALRSTSLSAISAGDWLNLNGVPHAQTLFALKEITVIPQPQLAPR